MSNNQKNMLLFYKIVLTLQPIQCVSKTTITNIIKKVTTTYGPTRLFLKGKSVCGLDMSHRLGESYTRSRNNKLAFNKPILSIVNT